ncbi:MAG: hypothetical protein P8O72_04985 [Flavobacteriaceae bacterium]|jgi:hypothetical protein|nr:hypothetical protein [Flavobacteriaceae bacterium]
MKKLLILTIAVTVFFGCSKDSDANTSEVYIRLSNISEYNFKNIVVNTSTGNVDFENIDSGQMSQYKNFETAYQYAFVELEIEGRIHTIQPIDYVEETPLEDGYYTYQIDANDSQEQYGRISLTIIEDKK